MLLAAEVQGGVREEQSPDQHGPRGSWDPRCQGGLQEHQQRKQLQHDQGLSGELNDQIQNTAANTFSNFSSTTRRSTRRPRTSGSGRPADQTLSTPPKTPCSRAMWVSGPRFKLGFFVNTVLPLIFRTVFNPQVEYKYDKEMMKGCVIPVSEDMYTQLYKKNAEMASQVSLSLLS